MTEESKPERDFLIPRGIVLTPMDKLLLEVARKHQTNPSSLRGHVRLASLVRGREEFVYLAHETMGLSFPRIARFLGGRHHTTIMHNYRKYLDKLSPASTDLSTATALADDK